jgi:nitroimidazol reductase NimA-like FMN-containing flavoprotein (pyridoxamine 5'-phosphate oxidase superfamily)
MSDSESIAMDTDARDGFLGTGGTGVISFSSPDEEPPYAVPISYGYDRSESTFYFRLAVGPDSRKGELAGRSVTFVVYGRQDEKWQSVVANGNLKETTEASIATESLEGLEQVNIPFVDIFGRPVKDVQFEFYRLVPDEMTSRTESTTAI